MDIQFTVEKGRVLVPVGIPCPFGCTSCSTRSGEVGPPRTTPQEILRRFSAFALLHNDAFTTVQIGYASDPFAYPERGIAMLHGLCASGKHLNFSTKACIEGELLDALREVRMHLEAHLTLSALVSLSCWESAPVVEPQTPTPTRRLRTISNLRRIGIPACIALRPVLPHITDAEYAHVIEAGVQAGSAGFLLGPLYADEQARFVRCVPQDALRTMPGRTVTVAWSAHAPLWTRYEDEPRRQRLAKIIEAQGGTVFWSSADAVERFIQPAAPREASHVSSAPPMLVGGLVLSQGSGRLQAFCDGGQETREPERKRV